MRAALESFSSFARRDLGDGYRGVVSRPLGIHVALRLWSLGMARGKAEEDEG